MNWQSRRTRRSSYFGVFGVQPAPIASRLRARNPTGCPRSHKEGSRLVEPPHRENRVRGELVPIRARMVRDHLVYEGTGSLVSWILGLGQRSSMAVRTGKWVVSLCRCAQPTTGE